MYKLTQKEKIKLWMFAFITLITLGAIICIISADLIINLCGLPLALLAMFLWLVFYQTNKRNKIYETKTTNPARS